MTFILFVKGYFVAKIHQNTTSKFSKLKEKLVIAGEKKAENKFRSARRAGLCLHSTVIWSCLDGTR
jgi:hypothetical protein